MGQVFAAFGIDWRLLLINSINFGILLLALWYFLYAPITKMLEERRQKVAKGVRDADESTLKLGEIEHSRSEILAKAGTEADEVLKKSRAAAQAKEREIVAAGEAAAANTVREAVAQAQELKAEAIEESKKEVAKMVVLGVEKMLKQ